MKQVIQKTVLVSVVCGFSAAISADTLWFDNGEKVRAIAQKYADVVNRDLPLQINEDTVWMSSRAYHNEIVNTVVMTDKDQSLKGVLARPADADSARAYWQRITSDTVCESPVARAFVTKGGVVNTVYEFENGDSIVDISIDSCE